MRYLIIIMFSFIFYFSKPAYCEMKSQSDSVMLNQEVQALEWMEMSAGQRMDHLMAAMYILNKNGVELSYSPDHYYDALYQKIQRNPGLYKSSIANILASYVYDEESKSRPALDRLRNKPLVEK